MTFLEAHAPELLLAQAYASKGREDASIREACADKINQIFDRLEALYERTESPIPDPD